MARGESARSPPRTRSPVPRSRGKFESNGNTYNSNYDRGVRAEREERAVREERAATEGGDYPPGRIMRRHGSRSVELRRLYGLTTQRSL